MIDLHQPDAFTQEYIDLSQRMKNVEKPELLQDWMRVAARLWVESLQDAMMVMKGVADQVETMSEGADLLLQDLDGIRKEALLKWHAKAQNVMPEPIVNQLFGQPSVFYDRVMLGDVNVGGLLYNETHPSMNELIVATRLGASAADVMSVVDRVTQLGAALAADDNSIVKTAKVNGQTYTHIGNTLLAVRESAPAPQVKGVQEDGKIEHPDLHHWQLPG